MHKLELGSLNQTSSSFLTRTDGASRLNQHIPERDQSVEQRARHILKQYSNTEFQGTVKANAALAATQTSSAYWRLNAKIADTNT